MANMPVLKLRILLWSILILVIFWLFWLAIVPTGKITYLHNFEDDNFFIKKLTPAERIEEPNNNSQKIIGDPAYFSLWTPRRFNQAKLTIRYKNDSELPLVEAGVLVDKVVWNYDLKPIQNKTIDQLSFVWQLIREGDTILLEKDKKYNSVSEFLNNLPNRDEIALYNYDLRNEFLLDQYQAQEIYNEFNYSLRGSYKFYTYIKNEPMDFDFTLADLNLNKDSDSVAVNIYYQDNLIKNLNLDDDGIINENGQISADEDLELYLENLPEGVYKIELRANDDIVTKKIITKQNKIAFINKLWLADENKENIILYSDSLKITAQTINPTKLQTIFINDAKLLLDETYKQFFIETIYSTSSGSKIVLEKDDVILSGDGVFGFSPENIINPDFKRAIYNIDNQKINYILTNYSKPREEDGYLVSEAVFDLSNAYREFNKYSFMISIPGLKADDNINDFIEIKEIKVELKGTSLLEKINKLLRKR